MIGKPSTKETSESFRFATFALFCFILPLCLSNSAHAQTLLRWKLMAGESLVVDVQQSTLSDVAFSGKSAKTKIDLGMQLRWMVMPPDEKGIKVKQAVERITFSIASAEHGAAAVYDSSDKRRPTGVARAVADAVKPLLGAEILVTMTDQGRIVTTEPINDAAKKLFAAVAKDEPPGVFSRQAVQKLLHQPLVVLPENAVAPDDTWTETSDVKSTAGDFQQTTTYRLAGQTEQEGRKLEKLDLTSKLSATTATPNDPAAKLMLKTHQQSGTVLFSTEEGRLVSAEQTQKLTTERPYRETTIVVTLESKQTTTMKAADK